MIAYIKSRLKGVSSLTANTAFLMFGVIAAKSINLAILPILSRLYTPESIGLLGVFTAAVQILSPLLTARYIIAIPLAKDIKQVNSLMALSLLLTLFLSAVIFTLMFIGEDLVSDAISIKFGYFDLIVLYSISCCFVSVSEIISMYLVRIQKFKQQAIVQAGQSLAGSSFKIIAGAINIGGLALLWAQFAQYFVSFILYIKFSGLRSSSFRGGRITFKDILYVAYLYIDMPKYRLLSQFITSVAIQSPVILIAILYSKELTGYFTLAFMAASVPVALLATTVSKVLYSELAIVKNNEHKIRKLVLSTTKKLLLVTVLPCIFIYLYGEEIFSFILGEGWTPVGKYISLMSLYIWLEITVMPMLNVLTIQNKNRQHLFLSLYRGFAIFTAISIPYVFGYSEYSVIYYYTAAMVIYFITVAAIVLKKII